MAEIPAGVYDLQERLALNSRQLALFAQELNKAYWQERARQEELEEALLREQQHVRALRGTQRELESALTRLRRAASGVITALAMALEQRDPYTEGHSQRAAMYCVWMGQELGLGAPELEAVAYAAEAHDIGKIGVPDSLLRKPGKLNESEWALMHQHPSRSAEIVGQLEFVPPAGLSAIRQHHERLDGSGYPDGIGGDAVCPGARMIAIADAFDAMTTRRPYNRVRTPQEALQELYTLAPREYDLDILRKFERGWQQHSGAAML